MKLEELRNLITDDVKLGLGLCDIYDFVDITENFEKYKDCEILKIGSIQPFMTKITVIWIKINYNQLKEYCSNCEDNCTRSSTYLLHELSKCSGKNDFHYKYLLFLKREQDEQDKKDFK